MTPLGGVTPTVGSNEIAVVMNTGLEDCPHFLWDTGTAAMSWGEVQKLRLEGAALRPSACVDSEGGPAVLAADAACLLPAVGGSAVCLWMSSVLQGTIGNALGTLVELLAANVGAGDPRDRFAAPEGVPAGEPNTCVFIFFAVNLAVLINLGSPPEGLAKKTFSEWSSQSSRTMARHGW